MLAAASGPIDVAWLLWIGLAFMLIIGHEHDRQNRRK